MESSEVARADSLLYYHMQVKQSTTMAGDTYTKYNTEVTEVEELYKEAVSEVMKILQYDEHKPTVLLANLLTIKNIAIKALKKQS